MSACVTVSFTWRVCHAVLKVLEKIRPLDQKLRYQIDKLIRVASSGLAGLNLVYQMKISFTFDIQFCLQEQRMTLSGSSPTLPI